MDSEPTPTELTDHATNLVGVPTAALADPRINDSDVRLTIPGVAATCPSLFEMLDEAPDPISAAEAFHKYMAAVFDLEPEQHETAGARRGDGARRFRSSYLRLLKGWGYDSNAPEGAVLKGWVESRFGLVPTWHGGPLRAHDTDAWMAYVQAKMTSRFHNNAIFAQLDLLYTFCQWTLRDRAPVTLYRGLNDFGEEVLVERLDHRTALVRLNNLVSFSAERGMAETFGDMILTTRVTPAKILFYPSLLPSHPLKGEAEYLVIGGVYRADVSYW